MAYISELQTLDLNGNSLQGVVPYLMLSNLKKMTKLHLHMNDLFGNIPAEIGELKNLKELTLFGNFFFGKVPSSIANLKKLGTYVSTFHKWTMLLLDSSTPLMFEGQVWNGPFKCRIIIIDEELMPCRKRSTHSSINTLVLCICLAQQTVKCADISFVKGSVLSLTPLNLCYAYSLMKRETTNPVSVVSPSKSLLSVYSLTPYNTCSLSSYTLKYTLIYSYLYVNAHPTPHRGTRYLCK